ncbi:MAG TPA: patatin-like phospholipase family protein [Flavobacterium sp.]|nr:patatin-like phospholipase family protein [Flavobacterium sp.]
MIPTHKHIGLTLSGGGTKGLAHAGVLKYLDDHGFTPSQIAGSSAGAIVGALYAFGQTPEQILEFFKSIYFFHWRHFTLKKPGLIDSHSFQPYFNTIFGDTQIGDLPLKLHITATDMVKGKLRIFGPETRITDAVLASAAVPGMMCPYEIDGNLYSDGGILNHFPADVLQGRCDHLIGVYVSPVQDIEAKDLNSIKSVMSRAVELLTAHSNTQKFNLCDRIIIPEGLWQFGTFETNKAKMDAIFESGYQAAVASFEAETKNAVSL